MNLLQLVDRIPKPTGDANKDIQALTTALYDIFRASVNLPESCSTINVNGCNVYAGSGAPSFSAAKGSLYLRYDGSGTNNRAYINTNGSTTWTAIVTVA